MKMIPISSLTPTTLPTKKFNNATKIPTKRFWEYALLKKTSEPFLFIAPEHDGYVSLADGAKKEMKEFFLHKTVKKVDGKDTYPDIVCTCGMDPYMAKPCLGCYMKENVQVPKGTINPWRKGLTTKWIILHLAWYYKVPRVDKDGKPVIYNEKQAFSYYLQTEGNKEDYEGKVEKQFGRLLKLDLGTTHSKNLLGIRKRLYWTCSGCMMRILTNSLICPECEETVMTIKLKDVEGKEETDKLDNIRMLIQQEHSCRNCGYHGKMIEGNDCGYTEKWTKSAKSKCPFAVPVRSDVFGGVAMLKKEGEKASSTLSMSSFNPIIQLSKDYYELPEEVLAEYPGVPVESIIEALKAKAIEEAGGMYDLDKEIEYLTLTLEQQAEWLSIPLPPALASAPRNPNQ